LVDAKLDDAAGWLSGRVFLCITVDGSVALTENVVVWSGCRGILFMFKRRRFPVEIILVSSAGIASMGFPIAI
jgi:hypothetical protein